MAPATNSTRTAQRGLGGFHFGDITSSLPRSIAAIMGTAFLVLGLVGFVSPGLLNTHLSVTHNVVHLVTGAMALYFAVAGTLYATRMFNGVFGGIYFLLGLAGFLLGSPGTPAMGHGGGYDERLLRVIPQYLELGTMDHLLHLVVGALFCLGAFTWGRARR